MGYQRSSSRWAIKVILLVLQERLTPETWLLVHLQAFLGEQGPAAGMPIQAKLLRLHTDGAPGSSKLSEQLVQELCLCCTCPPQWRRVGSWGLESTWEYQLHCLVLPCRLPPPAAALPPTGMTSAAQAKHLDELPTMSEAPKVTSLWSPHKPLLGLASHLLAPAPQGTSASAEVATCLESKLLEK